MVLFIVYACNKEAQINTANNYAVYKEWIHTHAGVYSNETIAVKTGNGNIISGNLNWNKLTQLIFEGKKYVYIPFNFQMEGKQYNNVPYDSMNKISETSFSLVLRENDANDYDVALNTKLYAVEFSANALAYQGMLENYYTVDGGWINSWFYDKGNDIPQKIYRKTSSDNSIVHTSMAPVCDEVSITTYETKCWQTGGPNNETACTSVATTITYTYCDTPGGGGGTGGTGGGGYPPSGGGDGGSTTAPAQDPCKDAETAAENATNISKSTGYSSGLNKVKAAASDNKEHGVSLNKNSKGDISSTPVSNGGEGSNDQPITTATVATIHNHTNSPIALPPSAGMFTV